MRHGHVKPLEHYADKPYYPIMKDWSEKLDGQLTAKELEVAYLTSRGSSNRAVADQLFITEKTVKYHMGRIFSKLGLKTRSELIAYIYNKLVIEEQP